MQNQCGRPQDRDNPQDVGVAHTLAADNVALADHSFQSKMQFSN